VDDTGIILEKGELSDPGIDQLLTIAESDDLLVMFEDRAVKSQLSDEEFWRLVLQAK